MRPGFKPLVAPEEADEAPDVGASTAGLPDFGVRANAEEEDGEEEDDEDDEEDDADRPIFGFPDEVAVDDVGEPEKYGLASETVTGMRATADPCGAAIDLGMDKVDPV